jgi:hypothetical protein
MNRRLSRTHHPAAPCGCPGEPSRGAVKVYVETDWLSRQRRGRAWGRSAGMRCRTANRALASCVATAFVAGTALNRGEYSMPRAHPPELRAEAIRLPQNEEPTVLGEQPGGGPFSSP